MVNTVSAADGTSIEYEDLPGSRATVVLVHGITESRETWRPIIDRLTGAGYRVIALDLRGHGASANADRYDLEAMAGDVIAVINDAGVDQPHLVGHSLGGVVVSAVGAAFPVASVVNVDQALQLGAFKDALTPLEPMLRDEQSFGAAIEGLFAELAGQALPAEEFTRISALRRPQQDVVLGVWELIFSSSAEDINRTVEEALAGFASSTLPYLSLFGVDPGPDYGPWISDHIPGAITEVWPEHGHYPHLIEPDQFVSRLASLWE